MSLQCNFTTFHSSCLSSDPLSLHQHPALLLSALPLYCLLSLQGPAATLGHGL